MLATATMKRKYTRAGWGFWLQWVGATSVGWAVGGVVLSACIGSFGDDIGNVAGNAALGLLAGIGQWLVLRQWLDKAGWWVLASAGGWLLVVSVGEAMQGLVGENAGGLILTIGLGFVPGILQWLLLRRLVARTGWWVLASTVLVIAALLAGWPQAPAWGLRRAGSGTGSWRGPQVESSSGVQADPCWAGSSANLLQHLHAGRQRRREGGQDVRQRQEHAPHVFSQRDDIFRSPQELSS